MSVMNCEIIDMMGSDFYYRDKIPVAILGATEIAGQWLVHLLANHPWFEIAILCGSVDCVGLPYAECVAWKVPFSFGDRVAKMQLQINLPPLACSLVFSALHSPEIEANFSNEGYQVVSCFCYRHAKIPLSSAQVKELAKSAVLNGQLLVSVGKIFW